MRRIISLLILIISCCTPVFAEPVEHYNNAQYLDLELTIDSTINLDYTDSSPVVEFIKSDLSFFPRNDERQTVTTLNAHASHDGNIQQGTEEIRYLWSSLPGKEITYGYDTTVRVDNVISNVNKKVPFPLTTLDSTVLTYTQPTEFIDITAKIEKKANEIIGTEDDLYAAVYSLAEWTHQSIDYNLNSLTAEAVQPSSWVLKNRQGVCDEMTNLFISFLRSVGVPARFVSGVVYTNLNYDWGPHGWAEVYFPDHGWVPFDVTFGEYGWLDPSHLKLKDDVDSGTPSATYAWKANGIDLDINTLGITTVASKVGPDEGGAVEISVNPVKTVAQFGSFIPIEITVTNIKNTYLAPKIVVTKAPGLTENNVKTILLEPKEERSLYWIAEIPEADADYVYTTTIEVQSMYGETDSATIKYGESFAGYTQEYAQSIVDAHDERAKKQPLTGITIDCTADATIYYSGDLATVTCDFTNTKSNTLNLDVCFQDQCSTLVAPPGTTTQDSTFSVSEGIRIPIIVEEGETIAYAYVNLNVIPIPEVYISDPEPSTIAYGEDVEINIDVSANTEVNNLHILFDFGDLTYDTFKEKEVRTVTLHTNSKLLIDDLRFDITYEDELGKTYDERKALHITVDNVPWHGYFANWLRGLF